jgi:hypothetical protein
MSNFPLLIVRNHVELADGLAAAKNFRGLSNEELEELTGLAAGAVDKLLGPSRVKGFGKNSLAWMLAALGLRLRIEPDPEQEQLMASRWQRRNHKQIRVYAHPVSMTMLRRAKPMIFAALSRKAALARLTKIPDIERSRIARKAAKARWKRRSKRHGQIANGNSGGPRATAKPAGAGDADHRAARPGAVARPRAPRHRAVPAGDHRQ